MRLMIMVSFALMLGACSALGPALSLVGLQEEVDFATGQGVEGVAKAIDLYCAAEGMFVDNRKTRLAEVNALTRTGDMSALDCDGDGAPDF